MSSPWMPLYVADYLADTRRLRTIDHGAYLLLIMEYWRHGGLPDNDEDLALIAGLNRDQWDDVRPRIERMFQPGWKHKRIDTELSKAKDISDARKDAAIHRWSKRNANGNAKALQQECQSQSQSQSQSHSQEELEATPLVADNPATQAAPVVSLKAKRAESDQALLDRITDQWNAWASPRGLAQVEFLTGQRATHCRNRLKDLEPRYGPPEEAFAAVLRKCESSFFIRGSPRSPLKFNQLMQEKFMVELMEGAYEHHERVAQWRR